MNGTQQYILCCRAQDDFLLVAVVQVGEFSTFTPSGVVSRLTSHVSRCAPGTSDRRAERLAAARGDRLPAAVTRAVFDRAHLVAVLSRHHPCQLQPVRCQRVRRTGRHVSGAASSQVCILDTFFQIASNLLAA